MSTKPQESHTLHFSPTRKDFYCRATRLYFQTLSNGRCPFCGEPMKKARDHGTFPKTRKYH